MRQLDTMKRKQFVKGVTQIAQEGAIQIFHEPNTGMEEVIVGVVGQLQFDVLEYRLKNEYNVEIRLENLPMSISAGSPTKKKSRWTRSWEPRI